LLAAAVAVVVAKLEAVARADLEQEQILLLQLVLHIQFKLEQALQVVHMRVALVALEAAMASIAIFLAPPLLQQSHLQAAVAAVDIPAL
jgi:hypothetical protein